jgi:invasion protein IalB
MKVTRFLFVLVLGCSIFTSASAQEPTFLSKHDAWTAYVTNTNGRKTCFAWSKPTKSQGKYTSRGDIAAFVTVYKPAPKSDDYYDGGQVSIVAGYRYKKESTTNVSIGSHDFKLFTVDDRAWAASPADDKKLIEAMKAGSKMTVHGISWRPTKTTDIYSLKGFTAAYKAIRAACK